jgi:hypothetical protein
MKLPLKIILIIVLIAIIGIIMFWFFEFHIINSGHGGPAPLK